MEMMATLLTSLGWWSTTRKCPLVQSKFSQKSCLLLQLQPSTTPTESFTRFRSGLVWVSVWNSCLRNGGFSFSGDSYFLFTLTFLQPLRSCWMSSDVVAQLTVPHIGVVAGRSASAAQLHVDSAAAQAAWILCFPWMKRRRSLMCEVGLHVELIQISIDLCDAQVIRRFRDLLCYDVLRHQVPRYPGKKIIANPFLLNISSGFDQKWI